MRFSKSLRNVNVLIFILCHGKKLIINSLKEKVTMEDYLIMATYKCDN